MSIPKPLRVAKHRVFGLLPGHIGLRNRACFHHLTKPSALSVFDAALEVVGVDDICIDCGANVGTLTQELASTGATVFAFEPDPWSFEELRKSAGHLENVTLINKAVGTRDGVIRFYRDSAFDDNPARHSVASSTLARADSQQEEIEVPVIDFISFLGSLEGRIKILKIDIEGAEVALLEALVGSPQVFRLDHVFVETHELQYPELLERTWALREATKAIDGVSFNLDWH